MAEKSNMSPHAAAPPAQDGTARRPLVAALFPKEAALPRLVSALLCEQIDAGLTSKIYLNMNPRPFAPGLTADFAE